MTAEERKAYNREYYISNLERIKEYDKKRRTGRLEAKKAKVVKVKKKTCDYYKISDDIQIKRYLKSRGFEIKEPGELWRKITINYIYENGWQLLVGLPKVRPLTTNRGQRDGGSVNKGKFGEMYPAELESASVCNTGFLFRDVNTGKLVVLENLDCGLINLEPVR